MAKPTRVELQKALEEAKKEIADFRTRESNLLSLNRSGETNFQAAKVEITRLTMEAEALKRQLDRCAKDIAEKGRLVQENYDLYNRIRELEARLEDQHQNVQELLIVIGKVLGHKEDAL